MWLLLTHLLFYFLICRNELEWKWSWSKMGPKTQAQTNHYAFQENLLKFRWDFSWDFDVIKLFFFFIPSLPHGDCTVIMCTLSPQQAKEMVMELIRDQGFREQRGEYGSRIGGDSLDVSTCHLFNSSRCWLGFLDRVNFAFLSSYCSGSCPTFCSRNCYREKWRNDQENSEWHRRQDSVQARWASNMTFMK